MNENETDAVASVLGGYSWQSGGGIFLVVIERSDGALVVVSDDCVCEYADQRAFDDGEAITAIRFS